MKRPFMLAIGMAFLTLPLHAQDNPTKPAPTDKPKTETPSGDLTDPVAILKKMDEAAKKVKSVRYTGELTFAGSLAQGPTVKGTAILAGESKDGLDKFRFEIKVQEPGQQEAREFVAGSDGNKFFMIDHKNKTAQEDIDDSVLGNLRELRLRFGMREFIHPEPFSDEINGKSEIAASEKIGATDCYKIHVVYASGLGEANWWVGKTDFLPHAVERLVKNQAGQPGSMTLKILELAADPTLPPETFTLKVPDGYKKESGTAIPTSGGKPGSAPPPGGKP